MVEAYPTLLAISYQVLPELRRVVEAWEVRAWLAGLGLLAAYLLIRLRSLPGWCGTMRGRLSTLR